VHCERAIGTNSLSWSPPGPFFDRGRSRRVAHTLHLIPADVKALPGVRGESGALAIEPARRPRRQAPVRPWIDARNRNRPAGANISSMTMSGQLPGVIYETYSVE